MTQFSDLRTWDDVVSYAAEMRSARDDYSWELGDLALYACPRNPNGGRPRAEASAEYTVSAFAQAIGEERSVVSQWMANAEFWPPDERGQLPPNVSWRQCSEARRRSGWRPGAEITTQQREFAWTLILKFADDGPDYSARNGHSTAEVLPVIVDGQGQRQVLLVGPRWKGVALVKVREA